jgi:oligopeptide transport system ATP-binding protein
MLNDDLKLLQVRNLKKYFHIGTGLVLKAVDDISFDIRSGETLGLVGESGCGKSTTGRTVIGMYPATEGKVLFGGRDISRLDKAQTKNFCKKAQMIFQDPYASLNPRMTVADIVGEGLDIHKMHQGAERSEKIYELLNTVGLNKEHASRFPHEFSGGQRQRIGIARALAIEPEFIVCDEPISALDVSIQAQIVNLLLELQRSLNLTYLFIAHDLSMVKHISDRVAVMYLGVIMELAASSKLYSDARHPYTQSLLSAIPIPDPGIEEKRARIVLKGDVPSPINPPAGCRFQKRCRFAKPVCGQIQPELKEVEKDHFLACHLY